jgi:hypothetical protein
MARGPWIGCIRFHGLLVQAARARGAVADPWRPVVLQRDGVVWDACRQARAAGVHPGQDAAGARALCPRAVRLPADAIPDQALEPAWVLLAEAAPVVEPDPDGRPEAMVAWPAGPPPLRELRGLLQDAATLQGVDLCVGLGPNRLLAKACCPAATDPPHGAAAAAAPAGGFWSRALWRARRDPTGCGAPPPAGAPFEGDPARAALSMVAADGGARFLAERPVAELVALGVIPPALARRLEGLGLRRCGDVAVLPTEVLRARFGREGMLLREACLGRDATPVRAVYPPRALRLRRAYPDGLPADALPDAAAALGEALAARLAPQEGAGRLVLRSARGEVARAFSSKPRRGGARVARAARDLAARAGPTWGDAPHLWLEVVLADLAMVPIAPVSLWGRTAEVARRETLEDLLARVPTGALRRGCRAADRYELLLARLDPWRARFCAK